MSRNTTRLGFLFAALLLLFVSVKPATAQDDYGGDIDYQEFYDELSPYGQWVQDPDHGYVWIPDAGDDFRPYYSNGHWAYTDHGNTWVSDYNWGWAPFHYGRWTYHSYYGWMWIPGNVWGPAWVSWRSGGGNYGWAPLGPGISINIAIGGYSCPEYWWNFAPQQRIFDRNWNRYSYGPRYNNTYINQTTIINNTYIVNRNTYLGGPRRDDLRRAIGREPRQLAINNVRGPQRAQVRRDRLNVYRPTVATNRAAATMRPRDFRPVAQPIRSNTPSSASGFGSRLETRPNTIDRGNRIEQSGGRFNRQNPAVAPDRQPERVGQPVRPGFDRSGTINEAPVRTQPERRGWNSRPEQAPRRFEQAQPQRNMEPAPQPQRIDRPQPTRAPRSFEQSAPQQPQRFERPQQAQPQRSFEQPRPQPQRFERPQQAQPQRSFEQPRQQPQRFEQPRPQPQRMDPRPQMQAPQRMEQPRAMPQQSPGGAAPMNRPGAERFGR